MSYSYDEQCTVVRLEWTPIEGATYTIYRRETEWDPWQELDTTTETHYEVSTDGWAINDSDDFYVNAYVDGCSLDTEVEWIYGPGRADPPTAVYANKLSNGQVRVQWSTSSPVNDKARIYVNDDPTPIATVAYSVGNPGHTFSAPCGDNDYYVQAIQEMSEYESCLSTKVPAAYPVETSAGVPSLQLPANGASLSGLNITFTWSAATCADRYWIQISRNTAFTDLVKDELVPGSDPTYTWPNAADGTFYWKVRAEGPDAGDYWSDYSPYWSFTHQTSLTLLAPVGGEHWRAGSQQEVRWAGSVAVDIEMNPNMEEYADFVTVATNLTGGSAIVTIPPWASTKVRVRVKQSGTQHWSQHAGYLTVVPQPDRTWSAEMLSNNGGPYVQTEISPTQGPQITHLNVNYFTGGLQVFEREWTSWVPGPTQSVPSMLATARDPSGNLLVAYTFPGLHQIRMHKRTPGGVWTTEIVASSDANAVAITTGSLGLPHIFYIGPNTDHYLYHTSRNSQGQWSAPVRIAGVIHSLADWVSAAGDASGNLHVVYKDETNDNLRYLKRVSGTWAPVVSVDESGNVGAYPSIAVNMSGIPHVAYYDVDNGDLKYATNPGSGWVVQTADPGPGYVGLHTSITLDSNDQPWVSYVGNGILHMARKNGGQWITTVADTSGLAASYTSIFMDPCQPSPRIAWHDPANMDLWLSMGDADATPPAAISDLWVQRGKTTAVVHWTTSGDDGMTGQACKLDARYSTMPITAANFYSQPKMNIGTPAPPGTDQCADVFGLVNCTTYYFAVRVEDDAYNSSMSNVVSGYHCGNGMNYLCGEFVTEEGPGEPEDIPRQLEFGSPFPNPGKDGMSVRLGIPVTHAGQLLNVEIYDASGRHVRQLADGPVEPGRIDLRWDLRRDRGGRVAPGVYFMRTRIGSEQRVKALTIVP